MTINPITKTTHTIRAAICLILASSHVLSFAAVQVRPTASAAEIETQSFAENLLYAKMQGVYLKHLDASTDVEVVRQDVLRNFHRNHSRLLSESQNNPALGKSLTKISIVDVERKLNSATKQELLAAEYRGLKQLHRALYSEKNPAVTRGGGGAIGDWMDMYDEDGPVISLILLPVFVAIAGVQALITILTFGQSGNW